MPKPVAMLPIESEFVIVDSATDALDCAEAELRKWNQQLDEREAEQSDGRRTRAIQEDA